MKGKIILENVSSNRDKWLALKRTTIGSSEINTICGINPYQSRLTLWAQKTGRIEPEKENDAMRFGSYMEPFIGQLFAEREQRKIIKPDVLYAHHEIDWATATPDFFSVPQEVEVISPEDDSIEIVEAKTVRANSKFLWSDGSIPNYAHAQTIWQLGVIGLTAGQVAALIGGNTDDFVTVPVTFSKELFDQMLDLAAQFMNMVKSDTAPEASAEDVKTLERMYAQKTELLELVEEGAHHALAGYLSHNKERKYFQALTDASEKLEDYYRAQLLTHMQGHDKATIDKYLITNKLVKRKAYTVDATEYFNFKVKDSSEKE